MYLRIAVFCLLFAVAGCSGSGRVTKHEREAVITGISAKIDAMNAAWRKADFAASARPFLDDAVMTFNGHRRTGAAAKAATGPRRFAGQYIASYTPHYDVLSRDVAVTTWKNDFARIALDGTRGPLQEAFMTIVWKRTADGWHIQDYHESTRPKALAGSATALTAYVGDYRSADGHDLQFTAAGGALHVSRDGKPPVALAAFTEPDFGFDGIRMTFIRKRDGTVDGVLAAYPDGSSRFAWRQ